MLDNLELILLTIDETVRLIITVLLISDHLTYPPVSRPLSPSIFF